MKFKVGDKVRILGHSCEIGTIIRDYADGFYIVKVGEGFNYPIHRNRLKYLKFTQKPIWRNK